MTLDARKLTGNSLLDALSYEGLNSLSPRLEWSEHALRDRISEPGAPVKHVHFPVSGLFSFVTMFDRDDQVEAGTIGREGYVGISTLLKAGHSPFLVVCQATGRSLRMKAEDFDDAASSLPELHDTLLRYTHCFMVQLTSTILANSSYTLEERLARWILMCQDRLGTTHFQMTHEFMALMLSVRRPGVTDAVHALEGRHLIRATRGNIEVVNREGLVLLAAGSYGQAEREFARLISPALR